MSDKNPFDYFDKIFCINLDSRPDRWEQVQKEFDKVGILDRVERFSALIKKKRKMNMMQKKRLVKVEKRGRKQFEQYVVHQVCQGKQFEQRIDI